jgi:hypothetical protein
MNELWITDECPARVLVVRGVSVIDPDCLVAYLEGIDKPLWIVENSGCVCGLSRASEQESGKRVYARRVNAT